MCGIGGIISRRPLVDEDRNRVLRISRAMHHRGPDGESLFVGEAPSGERGQVALVMRRLSIIDIAHGDQPFFNERGTIAVIANGEIYNYIEVRRELQNRGHRFKTNSDCEVILHLYEEYGRDCVSWLRGMFAFAVYDGRSREVFLARDRLGEKPLYLFRTQDAVYFASEAKALVRAGVVPFEISHEAVYGYLHWGFVPGEMCAIAGISKVEPGHWLAINIDTLEERKHCYWNARDAAPVEGNHLALLREELEHVAQLTVRSDVPVGICLSAGVDSSAIAALASKQYPGTLTGVTVGFAGVVRQDERKGARRFAQSLGIPLLEIELSPEEATRVLFEVCGATDEPLNDSAGSSIYCMMERCRAEGLKVMLNGLGGDELFWGYGWMRKALRMSERKHRRLRGHASLREYLAVEKPSLSYTNGLNWLNGLGGLRDGARRWRNDRETPERMVFWDTNPMFAAAAARVPLLCEPEWLEQIDNQVPFRPFTAQNWSDRLDVEIMCLTIETYLRENGLGQSDRLSSAHSVEMRTPLVDYRVVELAVGLQKANALQCPTGKAAFVSALEDLLPDWVTKRRKTGFSNPWRAWGREFARRYALLLVDGVLVQEGILRRDRVSQLCVGLDSGVVGNHDMLAHAFLRLELWARSFRSMQAATA